MVSAHVDSSRIRVCAKMYEVLSSVARTQMDWKLLQKTFNVVLEYQASHQLLDSAAGFRAVAQFNEIMLFQDLFMGGSQTYHQWILECDSYGHLQALWGERQVTWEIRCPPFMVCLRHWESKCQPPVTPRRYLEYIRPVQRASSWL